MTVIPADEALNSVWTRMTTKISDSVCSKFEAVFIEMAVQDPDHISASCTHPSNGSRKEYVVVGHGENGLLSFQVQPSNDF